MVEFKKAVEWMKEGKKVRRPDFEEKEYISLFDGSIPKFINTNKNNEIEYFPFDTLDFEANDWGLYQEEDNWSPIIYNINYETNHNDGDREWYEKETGNFVTEDDYYKLKDKILDDMKTLNDEEFNYSNIEEIIKKRFHYEK